MTYPTGDFFFLCKRAYNGRLRALLLVYSVLRCNISAIHKCWCTEAQLQMRAKGGGGGGLRPSGAGARGGKEKFYKGQKQILQAKKLLRF